MMHKMCSDESKCAAMKGCLCSDKKGHSEILLDKYRNFLVKRSFRNWSPAFVPEMCSDEFSLKHALHRGKNILQWNHAEHEKCNKAIKYFSVTSASRRQIVRGGGLARPALGSIESRQQWFEFLALQLVLLLSLWIIFSWSCCVS